MITVRKQSLLYLFYLALLFIPMSVSAAIVPVPVMTRGISQDAIDTMTREGYAVWRLGDHPLHLEVTPKDYVKFIELCKGKTAIEKSNIYSKNIKKANSGGCVFVFDKQNNIGYEIPRKQFFAFTKDLYGPIKEEMSIDVVDIETGTKTQVVNYKPIDITIADMELRPILARPEQVENAKSMLMMVPSKGINPFRLSNVTTIKIDDVEHKVSKRELNNIMSNVNEEFGDVFLKMVGFNPKFIYWGNIFIPAAEVIFVLGFIRFAIVESGLVRKIGRKSSRT